MARKSLKGNNSIVKYSIIALSIILIIIVFTRKFWFDHPYPAAASSFSVLGVDVSRHSGHVDWAKIKKKGAKFAYIKATEGSDYVDPLFNENLENASQKGILVGAYHFFRFNRDGESQAKIFLKTATPHKGQLIPVIDVETHGNGLSLKKDKDVIADIKVFITIVERATSIKPMVYTNAEAYDWYIKNDFKDYPLWICDLDMEPVVEADDKWDFWQFTFNGEIEGVRDDIDFNVYRRSYSDMVRRFVIK
jgi:lysozyme